MNKKVLFKNKNDEKLNSKVGKTLTYKQFVDLLARTPIRIKALV